MTPSGILRTPDGLIWRGWGGLRGGLCLKLRNTAYECGDDAPVLPVGVPLLV